MNNENKLPKTVRSQFAADEFLNAYNLDYTQFCRDFLIRFYPDSENRSEHKLVTLVRLIEEIGEAAAHRCVKAAMQSTDVWTRRRPLRSRSVEVVIRYR